MTIAARATVVIICHLGVSVVIIGLIYCTMNDLRGSIWMRYVVVGALLFVWFNVYVLSHRFIRSVYFVQVAHDIADRLLTVSPPSVESSIDSVLPFLTSEPVQAKRIRDGLVSQIDAIRRDDVYQAFYPLRFVLDEKRKRMVVEGVLKKLTGNTNIGETNASVILDFVDQEGELKNLTGNFNIGETKTSMILDFVARYLRSPRITNIEIEVES